MYLMYLDESGHSNLSSPRVRVQSDFFLLGGVIVKEENYIKCDKDFKNFKKKIFPPELADMPIHSVDLNQLSRGKDNPYKGIISESVGKDILKECYKYIAKCPIEAIAVIIDNYELKNKYVRPENPYLLAYRFVIEKFVKIVKGRKDLHNQMGVVNVAESSGGLKKNLQRIHSLVMDHGTEFVDDFSNILSPLNIEPMTKSSYYEIADLVCYAFQRCYYSWLCTDLGLLPAKDDYLSLIQPICTLEIGSVRVHGTVRMKVFPNIRKFKK